MKIKDFYFINFIMDKKIIGLFFTDLHLSDLTLQVCNDFITKMCEYIQKNNIKRVFFGGDFFEFRKGLTQDTLIFAKDIFEKLSKLDIQTYFLVGNHDKANPLIQKSYLTPFNQYFNFLFDEVTKIGIEAESYKFFFLPYYEGDKLKEELNKLQFLVEEEQNKGGREFVKFILVGHVMYEQIPVDISKNLDLILLGHFHDLQEFPKGKYIGSCYQQNFAEDKYKGWTILYSDLSNKQVKFNSKEYIVQSIDLNCFTEEKAKEFILEFKNKYKDKYLRLEFVGFNKDISTLKDFCKLNGVDCISKIQILSNDEEKGEQITISTLSQEQILNYYNQFKENQTYSEEVDKILSNFLFEN